MSLENKDRAYYHRQALSFFGKIMANVSHEFNNVITVIGELSGLLQDLAMLADKGKPIQTEKLQQITQNISRQVARAKELINNMNRFSHSVDDPISEFDAAEAAENMKILTHRLVERKQQELDFQSDEARSQITTDPFTFRQVFFTCLELMMGASSDSNKITMALERDKDDIKIVFSKKSEGNSIEDSNGWADLASISESLGGKAELIKKGSDIAIKVSIPSNSQTD